jgi:hypothetical protein
MKIGKVSMLGKMRWGRGKRLNRKVLKGDKGVKRVWGGVGGIGTDKRRGMVLIWFTVLIKPFLPIKMPPNVFPVCLSGIRGENRSKNIQKPFRNRSETVIC